MAAMGLGINATDVGQHERRGRVRYPTMLHPAVPERLINALTPGPENGGRAWQALVVDLLTGGGESAEIWALWPSTSRSASRAGHAGRPLRPVSVSGRS